MLLPIRHEEHYIKIIIGLFTKQADLINISLLIVRCKTKLSLKRNNRYTMKWHALCTLPLFFRKKTSASKASTNGLSNKINQFNSWKRLISKNKAKREENSEILLETFPFVITTFFEEALLEYLRWLPTALPGERSGKTF